MGKKGEGVFGDFMGRGVFSRLLSQIFHNSDTVGRHIPSLVRAKNQRHVISNMPDFAYVCA
jgi:hypothetical protein